MQQVATILDCTVPEFCAYESISFFLIKVHSLKKKKHVTDGRSLMTFIYEREYIILYILALVHQAKRSSRPLSSLIYKLASFRDLLVFFL